MHDQDIHLVGSTTTHNDMSTVDSTLLYMLAASSQNGPTDLDAIWSVPSVL